MKNIVNKLLFILLIIVFIIVTAVFVRDFTGDERESEKAAEKEEGPVITLRDDEKPMEVIWGEKYKDPGFSASDAKGNDLSMTVAVDVPSMKCPGTYKVKYAVKDAQGREARASRDVEVVTRPQTEASKKRGLAVLMYHNVYDPKNPPDHVDTNMITTKALKEELQYLVKAGYNFPRWQDVRDYLDGKISLPEKSVVLTFDDGTELFQKNGAPLLEKYDVRATSFVICSHNWKKMVGHHYKHIDLESHSYDMHRPGGTIGHGGVFTALSVADGVKDLKKSQRVLGSSDAFAYPFGDYNDTAREAVKKAGFKVAFTTQYGKIYPGDDPLLLPRVRVNGSPSLAAFRAMIGE